MYGKLSCGSVKNLLKPLGDSTATDEPEGFFVMKKCVKCEEVKPFKEFRKHKTTKDGRDSYCRVCGLENSKNHTRSLNGRIMQMYRTQKQSSKDRHHKKPSYSRDEFIDWMLNNKDYLRLHDEWVKSGYKKSLAPSVDRLDDYKGYGFDNIQVITWGENNKKGYLDRINGINNKTNKAVVKISLNGTKLKTYYSISQAARDVGCSVGSICRVCNGKRKTTRGFIWKYEDNINL